jgi:hypothetical protein
VAAAAELVLVKHQRQAVQVVRVVFSIKVARQELRVKVLQVVMPGLQLPMQAAVAVVQVQSVQMHQAVTMAAMVVLARQIPIQAAQ